MIESPQQARTRPAHLVNLGYQPMNKPLENVNYELVDGGQAGYLQVGETDTDAAHTRILSSRSDNDAGGIALTNEQHAMVRPLSSHVDSLLLLDPCLDPHRQTDGLGYVVGDELTHVTSEGLTYAVPRAMNVPPRPENQAYTVFQDVQPPEPKGESHSPELPPAQDPSYSMFQDVQPVLRASILPSNGHRQSTGLGRPGDMEGDDAADTNVVTDGHASASGAAELGELLLETAEEGDMDGLKAVLRDPGTDVNFFSGGTHALFLASTAGHTEAVKLLLQASADANRLTGGNVRTCNALFGVSLPLNSNPASLTSLAPPLAPRP